MGLLESSKAGRKEIRENCLDVALYSSIHIRVRAGFFGDQQMEFCFGHAKSTDLSLTTFIHKMEVTFPRMLYFMQ